jgi:hypothetical protein
MKWCSVIDKILPSFLLFIYLMILPVTQVIYRLRIEWLVKYELQEMRRKQSWHNLRYYPNIFWEYMSKTEKKLNVEDGLRDVVWIRFSQTRRRNESRLIRPSIQLCCIIGYKSLVDSARKHFKLIRQQNHFLTEIGKSFLLKIFYVSSNILLSRCIVDWADATLNW